MAEYKEQKLPGRVNQLAAPCWGTPPGPVAFSVLRGLRRRLGRVAREPHEGPHFRFKPAITRKLGYFRLSSATRRLCKRGERPSKLPVAASRQLSATRRLSARGIATRLPVASPEAAPNTGASNQPAQRRARQHPDRSQLARCPPPRPTRPARRTKQRKKRARRTTRRRSGPSAPRRSRTNPVASYKRTTKTSSTRGASPRSKWNDLARTASSSTS